MDLLDAPQKNQNQQDQDYESQTAAWVIPPVLAVGPGGQCAHKHENQDYQQNRSDGHVAAPLAD